MDEMSITEITEEVLDKSGYLSTLKASKSLEAQTRLENLEEFISVTQSMMRITKAKPASKTWLIS